jgi:hypothetical protein
MYVEALRIILRLLECTLSAAKRGAMKVEDCMPSPREFAAQLHLERMPGVIVYDDAQLGRSVSSRGVWTSFEQDLATRRSATSVPDSIPADAGAPELGARFGACETGDPRIIENVDRDGSPSGVPALETRSGGAVASK